MLRTSVAPIALSFSLALAALGCGDDGASASSGAGGSAETGSGGGGGAGGAGGGACVAKAFEDPLEQTRASCAFGPGAKVSETLGFSEEERLAIPLTHLVVVMQENRSFDHYFGTLSLSGQPDAEGWPEGFSNPDAQGTAVSPHHLDSTCLADDPPHQWDAMHAGWNGGAMDGFVTSADVSGSDGHFVMGYYAAGDLPFYHWLASTFAMSDRYFGAALGGTWANRDYLYAGTSDGVKNTGQATIDVPTVFDSLDAAGVSWGVYTDGNPRQDALGWTSSHEFVFSFQAFLDAMADGSLPAVSFVDPGPGQDEHPDADVQLGEAWSRQIYEAAIASPLWPTLAVIHTYDESGGLADHVPPPAACIPSPDQDEFDRLGIRVPMMVVSPWARPHYVSHRTHEHSSVLRLIELLHDLPALTARDASADALLDLFDFECGGLAAPPSAPEAGTLGCL